MNDRKSYYIEQIENYLSGNFSPEEKLRFETALKTDAGLNEYFRLYQAIDTEMRETQKYRANETALKNTLKKLNAVYFGSGAKTVPMHGYKKWYRLSLSAAAVLILVLTAYFLFFQRTNDLPQYASRYVKNELSQLSLTMDGGRDSLQQGMAAFNDKAYARALQIFKAIYEAHPENNDALKYAGITCLVTRDYDQAIACFEELAAKKGLFSNPGVFLKAVVLLARNEGGDVQEAKLLLRRVVDENLDGSTEAARWLK